ncbi:MAG: hypothetical protein DWQ34_28610, partial [Planctomycetota bacterium]
MVHIDDRSESMKRATPLWKRWSSRGSEERCDGSNVQDHGAAVIDIEFKTDDAGRSRASFCSSALAVHARMTFGFV